MQKNSGALGITHLSALFIVLLSVGIAYTLTSIYGESQHVDLVFKIVSNIAGIILLYLGLFYYLDKRNIDARNRSEDLHAQVLALLRNEYTECELLIHRLCQKNLSAQEPLDALRTGISIRFDNIERILESKSLNLLQERTQKIIDLYSYVEKSHILMRSSIEEFLRTNLSEISDEVFRRLREGKVVLY